MKLQTTTQLARLALGLTLSLGGAVSTSASPQGLGPPIIDYLEIQTLTPHQRVSIHGVNLDQAGQVHIGGIEAFVVPIPGTNAVKMNAYVPADTPYGFNDVTVTTAAGTSNPLSLEVVPRTPEGRKLWRFFMNNQVMIHRPQLGADGTIYAKSQAGDVIAITPDGEMEWFLQIGPDLTPQIDVGPDGTIYTAGNGATIYAINPDGTIRWTFTDPFPNQGVVSGPNVGPDGNVYAVSHVPGLGIFSLDPEGQLRWSGPDQGIYSPWGQQGQELVFSDTQLFFCVDDIFESFDFEGDRVFQEFTVTQQPGNSPQIAVGPNGDSYVEFWGQLMSFDPSGNQNWMAFGAGGSYLREPDVGPDGTVYTMRNVFNTFHALNPDGSEKWTYNHPETLLNPVVDPTGETILVGGGGFGNAFYLALDTDGNPEWQVDLPVEPLTPFETVQAFPQGRARFTPDGSVAYVMASSTSNSGGHSYLYAIQVAESVSVGHGMPGTQGIPRLDTLGSLTPGAPCTVRLQAACQSSPAFLIVGSQPDALPVLGGVLVPRPELVLPLASSSSGDLQFTFPWPTGIPSDTSLYMQYWIVDPAGPSGWVASNAVSLITP